MRNIQQPTSNIEHPFTAGMAAIGCSMLDVGCWMFVLNLHDAHEVPRPPGIGGAQFDGMGMTYYDKRHRRP